jgi:hypothetical protein
MLRTPFLILMRLKSLLPLAFIVVLGSTVSSPELALCKSGCCSWHGGVASCGSGGKYMCNDGTESPTCTCGSSPAPSSTDASPWTPMRQYVPPTCSYPLVPFEDQCVDPIYACIRKLGSDSQISAGGQCECKQGYEIQVGTCKFIKPNTNGRSDRVSALQRRLKISNSSSSSAVTNTNNPTACLTRAPCTCPSGYKSVGNKQCVLN